MIVWMRKRWRGWARIDPELLYPVQHRSAQAQADLMMIRARAGLVRARTGLVNTARGLAKSYGERLRGCNVRNMNPEKAEGLSPELQAALEPLLNAIESLSERIVEYNERIEKLAQQSYPKVALLKQIKGVGTLIALTYMLTLENPHRFGKSRDRQFLNYGGRVYRNRAFNYIGTRKKCGPCSLRPQCTSAAFRGLILHQNEPARQRARELVNTPEFAKAQRQRKKVEALFAELKNQIGLRRLRLRRLKFVREQFFLAAVAQNIKRLVRFLSRPLTPTTEAAA